MALIITIIILHGKIHVICLHSKMKILTWVSLYAVLAKNENTAIERCSASLQGKTYITRLLYNVTCISVISVLNGVKREGWCFTSIELSAKARQLWPWGYAVNDAWKLHGGRLPAQVCVLLN